MVFRNLGVQVPEILLPNQKVDLAKWSVVACDQYTSQPDYWYKVERLVGDSPSTLRLTLPEIFLEKPDLPERINNINRTMEEYLKENILVPQEPCMIYVDRKTPNVPSRKGLIMALDLEMYDYNMGARTLIRATEGTVLDRLPPRIRIREKAAIELPHVMVLIDDPERTVIEPLAEKADSLEKLYDFELMMGGGHIKGYRIDDRNLLEGVAKALEKLADPDLFMKKYNVGPDKGVLLFAVGDGNHSLAAAKAYWEKLKQSLDKDQQENHPARFALVEVVNIHDEGLVFEPIHRVVFNVDPEHLLNEAVRYFNSKGNKASYHRFDCMSSVCGGGEEQREILKKSHVIPFVTYKFFGILLVQNPSHNLEVGTLQDFLDCYLRENGNAKIDYIHGNEVVKDLGSREGNIGFLLPAISKHSLFKTITLEGVLPRKTFSMGEANEKRYYLECRKIVKQ